jgi:hypothetical protein
MRKFQLAICATAALGFCLMAPKGASAFPAANSASKAYTQTVESKSAATPVRFAGRGVGVGRGIGVRRGIGFGRGIGWRRGWGWRRVGWRRGWYGGWGGYGLGLGYGLGTGWGYGGSYAATSGGCCRRVYVRPCGCGCGGGGLFGGLFF